MVCCQNGRTYLVLLGPALLQCALHLGDPLDPLTSQEGMRTLMCDFIGSPPRLLPALWDAQRGQMLLALVVPLVANAVELLLGAGVSWLAPHTRALLGQANPGSNTAHHCCPRWLPLSAMGAGGQLRRSAYPLSTTTTGNVGAQAPCSQARSGLLGLAGSLCL